MTSLVSKLNVFTLLVRSHPCRLLANKMSIPASLFLIAIFLWPLTTFAQSKSEWTVMVFLNGNNNLEPFALANFKQMATVGSSDAVNIVVQFARSGLYAHTNPQWKNTLRFRVTKGMSPLPTSAVQDIGDVDMGNPQSLIDFVDWSAQHYPASHYMLILWDHGQGYRAVNALENTAVMGAPTSSPYRTISSDDVHHSLLYMRDVENALEVMRTGRPSGTPAVDVIGFDACLMAMVETAYAVRNGAKTMVASQELEPGPGWNYTTWLPGLITKPTMDSRELGSLIVTGYKSTYGDPTRPGADPTTTMSETDLTLVPQLAASISKLADTLIANLNSHLSEIKAARDSCPEYAPNPFNDDSDYFFHIDLGCFTNHLKQTSSSAIRDDAERVRVALEQAVVQEYTGNARLRFGSSGLCIYFPASDKQYKSDGYAENGYEKSNTNHPVEFVQTTNWSDFLHAYFAKVQT